ncbi:M28 family peptidase [Methylobacterium sp. J-077]|uniref:M28 family peptidase n=1 Tax=Methylobacterium sp. J-077 TaxID=2836656 RepID=UPI001FBBB421|nr:M28 family peptidase [Methylobacterium sp. J-077]MCJ2123416.1 M28 family peptidase [Methylobacterium sp. J-077]
MTQPLPSFVAASILSDRLLPDEFAAICDCGGRLAGTSSEDAAKALLRCLGEKAAGRAAGIVPTPYDGWRSSSATLERVEGDRTAPLGCHPLVRTVATPPSGLEAEVVDVGRGTEAEFTALAPLLAGRIALVRHEYMFAPGHIHRRLKYAWAREAGAVGFLIAGPLLTRPVAGSSGRGREDGIPALGITPEAAARLAPTGAGYARARLTIVATEFAASTEAILFDLPGQTAETVVLSAHLDGHDLAESAMDNATGVAAALAVTRALAPHARHFRRGLRLAFFSAEEWALTGSRVYLDRLPEAERETLALNINLDSVAGSGRLTALCSGLPGLAAWAERATGAAGVPVGTFLPPMANSDHANFTRHGVPALRLVAGFDEGNSNLRYVLTAADTRDKVTVGQLRLAALAAAAMVWSALTDEQLPH